MVRMFNCGKKEEKENRSNSILSNESRIDLQLVNTDEDDNHDNDLNNRNIGTDDINKGAKIIDCDLIHSYCSNSLPTTTNMYTICLSSTCGNKTETSEDDKFLIIERTKRQVSNFVQNVLPALIDVDELINELNMNDPTKA